MARNQVVMPGFAAFHVGIQAAETPVEHGDTIAKDEKSRTDDGAYIDGISE